jgi:hypothetical protein
MAHAAEYIVETGCLRKQDNWQGDGQSTLLWSEFRRYRGVGTFHSVDIDEDAVCAAKLITAEDPNTEIVRMDSVKYLRDRKVPIDILYLDSLDCDQSNPHPAALHCLMELTAAMPMLRRNSIVFVDDSPMGPGLKVQGKGLYVAEFMEKLGIHPFAFAYQVAWLLR